MFIPDHSALAMQAFTYVKVLDKARRALKFRIAPHLARVCPADRTVESGCSQLWLHMLCHSFFPERFALRVSLANLSLTPSDVQTQQRVVALQSQRALNSPALPRTIISTC